MTEAIKSQNNMNGLKAVMSNLAITKNGGTKEKSLDRQQTSQRGILDLPREVRNLIYVDLLVIDHRSDFLPDPHSANDFSFKVLHLNRQMRSEGLEILRDHHFWVELSVFAFSYELAYETNFDIVNTALPLLPKHLFKELGSPKISVKLFENTCDTEFQERERIAFSTKVFAFTYKAYCTLWIRIQETLSSRFIIKVTVRDDARIGQQEAEVNFLHPLRMMRGWQNVTIEAEHIDTVGLETLMKKRIRSYEDMFDVLEDFRARGKAAFAQKRYALAMVIYDTSYDIYQQLKVLADELNLVAFTPEGNQVESMNCDLQRNGAICRNKVLQLRKNGRIYHHSVDDEFLKHGVTCGNDALGFIGINDHQRTRGHYARGLQFQNRGEYQVLYGDPEMGRHLLEHAEADFWYAKFLSPHDPTTLEALRRVQGRLRRQEGDTVHRPQLVALLPPTDGPFYDPAAIAFQGDPRVITLWGPEIMERRNRYLRRPEEAAKESEGY